MAVFIFNRRYIVHLFTKMPPLFWKRQFCF